MGFLILVSHCQLLTSRSGVLFGLELLFMKAAVLTTPAPISQSPLKIEDVPTPEPRPGHVLLRVLACGVCHTVFILSRGTPAVISSCSRSQIVGEVVAGDVNSRSDRVGADAYPRSAQSTMVSNLARASGFLDWWH